MRGTEIIMGPRTKRWLYPFLVGVGTYSIARLIQLTLMENLATAATIWAAFGTLAAVIVALVLAQSAALEKSQAESKKHAAAAIMVSQQLYKLHAILDVIAKSSALVRTNREGYAKWLSTISQNLRMLEPVIQDKHLPIVIELPSLDLFTLTICDEWFNNFRDRHVFAQPILSSQVVEKFDSFIDELIRGQALIVKASERFHELSGLPGPPPWASYDLPSWVAPRKG